MSLYSIYGSPSVPHPPQFNASVPHKTTTPFQPPKSPSVPHQKPLRQKIAEECVELRGFWCGTERVLVWDLRGVLK